jgi:nitroimidazol reductase NimA-like FMN-containing flavoprotein (pyridoxamine 5'-phosphate oxidase superfamily)
VDCWVDRAIVVPVRSRPRGRSNTGTAHTHGPWTSKYDPLQLPGRSAPAYSAPTADAALADHLVRRFLGHRIPPPGPVSGALLMLLQGQRSRSWYGLFPSSDEALGPLTFATSVLVLTVEVRHSKYNNNPRGVLMADEELISELTLAECWDMLRAEEFGRLAFRLVDEIHITPINYAVNGETLLFRTAEGNKLLGVLMSSAVAFEIDSYGEDRARSVVVRGDARLLPEDEAHRAENTSLRSWVPTLKYNVVEIAPSVVTGREFSLSRPWMHLRLTDS